MLVTVKALQGRECSLQVAPQERVVALKRLVAERLQVPVEQQRLLFRGKALADEQRLCDYSIGPSARLNLVLKPPRGENLGTPPVPPLPPPEDLGDPPLPPPTFGAAFGGALAEVLGRHFGEGEAPKILQQLQKDYAAALRALSLDDVERLGTRLLQPDGAPPEPPQ